MRLYRTRASSFGGVPPSAMGPRAAECGAERGADANESRLADFLALSNDWFWEQDADLRISYLSANFSAVTGLDPERTLGRCRWEYDDSPLSPEEWQPHRELLIRREAFRDFRFPRRNRNGELRWLSISGQPIFGEEAEFLGYRGVGRDITASQRVEQSLRASEELFRASFEQAPIGIGNVSLKGEWLWVNETLCTILGRSRGELVGCPIASFFQQLEHAEGSSSPLGPDGVKPGSAEYEFRRPDGSAAWVSVSVSVLRSLDGTPRYAIVAIQDVSIRQHAQALLLASEQRYRRLVELSPEAIIVEREGTIVFVNQALVNLLGLQQRKQVLGRPVLDIIHPDFHEGSVERRKTLKQTENVALPPVRVRLIAADGSTVETEGVSVSIEFDGAKAVLTLFRDVTARLAAEQALMKSQAQYREVVDNVHEVIFRTDDEGVLSFLNPAWAGLSGVAVEQGLGRRLEEFIHELDSELYRRLFNELVQASSDAFECELRFRAPDGTWRWAELAARASREGGRFLGAYGTLYDITARKQAEDAMRDLNSELERRVRARTAELEASNRELEAFSYSVSHDLRAPLRAIDGFSQIVIEDYESALDDAGRSHLRRIRAATQRMASLIDDLLELGRITRATLSRRPVDLSAIARNILRELREGDPAREVELLVGEHIAARADPALVEVLLDNLLRNAWKFTGKTPAARIEFNTMQHGRESVLYVRDNGAGFDMAHAGQLFRPFQRLHDVDQFGGTGIGLATVQRIVQRHGGRIWAEGTLNQGATFYFTLPDGK